MRRARSRSRLSSALRLSTASNERSVNRSLYLLSPVHVDNSGNSLSCRSQYSRCSASNSAPAFSCSCARSISFLLASCRLCHNPSSLICACLSLLLSVYICDKNLVFLFCRLLPVPEDG